jgi:hypothetical protein
MGEPVKRGRGRTRKTPVVDKPIVEKKAVVETPAQPIVEKPIVEEPMSKEDFVVPEFNDAIPSSFDSPIDEPVMERSYNKVEVIEMDDIPEPDLTSERPVFEDAVEVEDTPEEKKAGIFDDVRNPEMNDLPPKEKKEASGLLANTLFDGVRLLYQLGAKGSKINESKIDEKIISGEIDPDLSVPIAEDGSSLNIKGYSKVHNEQVDEIFKLEDDFVEEVKPVLIRVLAKKGLGVTDEQFLIIAFGKEVATKAIMFVALKKQGNEVIKQFAKASQQNRASAMQEAPTPVFTPDTIQSQPKEAPTTASVKVATAKIISTEDVEAEMMED